MSKATSEEWVRYYDFARQRRRGGIGDPLAAYKERMEAREKRLFVASGCVLLAVIAVFYSLLIR
jgi:type II secretory pathway component PulM